MLPVLKKTFFVPFLIIMTLASFLATAQANITRWTFDGSIRNNALAISPDETMAIASNSDTSDILIYDLATEKLRTTLSGYVTPRNIVFSPKGDVFYVSDSSQGVIFKIDSHSLKTLAQYPVGYGAFGTAITPDGKTLYINNQAANSVTVLNLDTGRPAAIMTGFAQPRQGIKISPDGKQVFVTNFLGDKISIIDANTHQIVDDIIGFHKIRAISITSDGKTLFAANSGSNDIAVVDIATRKITKTIPVGKEPYGAALMPNGSEIYTGNLGDNTLSVITVPSMHVTATITGLSGPRQAIVFAKDLKTAYVLNENLSIALVDIAKQKVERTITPDGQ